MLKTLLAALTCLLVVGCASGDSTATTPADTTAPPADAGATAGTITMASIAFSGVSTVSVGDTIELVNQDDVPHTFTDENESFDVSIPAGETRTHTFEEPGEYSYFCTIHPSMEGMITVEG